MLKNMIRTLGQGGRCARLPTLRRTPCLPTTTLLPSAGRPRALTVAASSLTKPIGAAPWRWQSARSLPRLPCRAVFTAADIVADVGVMVEGEPGLSSADLDALAEQLYGDARAAVQAAAAVLVEGEDRDAAPGPLELSLVLCDDAHIAALNLEWRGKEGPTDVLSFEMGDGFDDDLEGMQRDIASFVASEEEEEEDSDDDGAAAVDEDAAALDSDSESESEGAGPATLLGDVVISLDTAARQAAERGHSLRDECRVLVVHGVLHLLGYDHENGGEEEDEMAETEAHIMAALGWKGQGLIAAAAEGGDASSSGARALLPRRTSDVRFLLLDMDGTLLDSSSRVLPSSVTAIRAALAAGITVMLATGKARPAAMAAMAAVGLAGDGLVVGPRHPGLFLQGLAVHGLAGELIGGATLPPDVVRAAFEYAEATGTPICGFSGDECVTLGAMTPEIRLLHDRYYEPLAEVAPSAAAAAAGPPLRKLLFMTTPEAVAQRLKPHWEAALAGSGAAPMQAVPDMLEVVPAGFNKFVGLQQLLAAHPEVALGSVMAVGDGSNDLELVAGVGLGVAMANAVPAVKAAAAAVVASNDEGGVAQAIEEFIL